jgi:hypothetical protein
VLSQGKRFFVSRFFFINNIFKNIIMAKGPEKNTKNKALHTKLLNRKKMKIQEKEKEKALRLKSLVAKINEKQKSNKSEDL